MQLTGTGLEYDDFTWASAGTSTFDGCNTAQTFAAPPEPPTFVIINEVDADNPGIDALEFVELFDGGVGNTALDGLVVVFFTGASDASYAAFDLDGYSTDAGGFFVLGNAAVANVDLVFGDNTLQNGADAVTLYAGSDTDFANGTAVTTTDLFDAFVYDTDDADDAGLLVLLNAGQPQVNEDGAGDKDNDSSQRISNGAGGARNTSSYVLVPPAPGAVNAVATNVLINELDADNPGTDALEFVELFDGGAGNTPLDGLVVVFYNGATDQSYASFDLGGYSTDANGYFVLGNAGVANVDLIFGGNALQNGGGDGVNHSNQRIPNGAGDARNTNSYAQITPTPGAINVASPSIDIEKATNGVDADAAPGPHVQPGQLVEWTYTVTNTGNVLLSGVFVTDDQGETVSCPQTTLVAGESMTCTASALAIWGQYTNTGSATATPPAGLSDVSDSDASHYVGVAIVDIDIQPGQFPNQINPGKKGRLPVAILTTLDFDAAIVDPASLTLGNDDGNDTAVAARNNGTLFASLADIDDDGDMDLILHFDIPTMVGNGDIAMGTTSLTLNGLTAGGLPIQGVDAVVIVP